MLRLCSKLVRDESAQTTVEYVLMLLIVVGFIIVVLTKFVYPTMRKLTETVSAFIDKTFFRPQGMHQFPVRGSQGGN